MMFISVPDPTISASISNNPMPAARAKDVETAGRTFLCWLPFFCGVKGSSPRRELKTNQRNANDRDGFWTAKGTLVLLTLSCGIRTIGIDCLLLSNKRCGNIKQRHIEQLGYQIEYGSRCTNSRKFSRAWHIHAHQVIGPLSEQM